jgi:hypothetical protein
MAKRYYQLGDYTNTIERKVLENQVQNSTTGGTLAGNTSPSTPVRYAASGDDDNTIWRKILENYAHSLP